MIGVICDGGQKPAVAEFFELFKVRWEHYVDGRRYDVVVAAGHSDVLPQAGLVIVFGPASRSHDICPVATVEQDPGGLVLDNGGHRFPVYERTATFEVAADAPIRVAGNGASVAHACVSQGQHVLRIGYDLFDEVAHVLTHGQPVDHAKTPVLEIHADVLRQAIVAAGFELREVPPVPAGYRFAVCLTHDVDFVRLRDQGFDRSLLGFVVRAVVPTLVRDTASRIAWSRVWANWKAVLSLPLSWLGWCRDAWFDIDRYAKLEKGLNPTYFFIPTKGHHGAAPGGMAPTLRAARYDVRQYRSLVEDLRREGAEIGTHGLDAWRAPEDGRRERDVISACAGEGCQGVRMHWLYFSRQTPAALEAAGFRYDSTLGYNDAVGFRSGTTQAFCLPGTSLLELPLNVMDTALFYRSRMALSEADALRACQDVIDSVERWGGVLTINWHTRSLSPERNWGAFYEQLLDLLKRRGAWFANARVVAAWFEQRRALQLAGPAEESQVPHAPSSAVPGFTLRVHRSGRAPVDGPYAEATMSSRAAEVVA